MGREVKRISMDFDWPLNKVWDGFLNPHYRQCPHCHEGIGATSANKRLEELVRLILLSGEETVRKRGGVPHPYFEWSALHSTAGMVVSDDMLELAEALSDRKLEDSIFGFDSTAVWRATKKIIEAAGLDEKWGWCKHCDGDGVDPAIKEAYEAWRETEPPAGDGWQMWETTSEGSPISPVCETPEALARWLADNKASTFGSDTTDYDTWLRMIKGTGWAMSMVADEKGLRSGVEAMADSSEPA